MPTAGTGFPTDITYLNVMKDPKKGLVWESLRINLPYPFEVG